MQSLDGLNAEVGYNESAISICSLLPGITPTNY
jgi:hypothetical protein